MDALTRLTRMIRLLAIGLFVAVSSPVEIEAQNLPAHYRNHPDFKLFHLARAVKPGPLAASATSSRNLSLVGSLALPGFNADVWAHAGFAYVGTWGFFDPGFCPATGVRIIDLSRPAQPRLVRAVAAIPGTTQEDVVVRRVHTAFFNGDLLVTGIQSCFTCNEEGCFPTGRPGVAIWDVTNPLAPRRLGFWSLTGGKAFGGVHELDLFQQENRAYVAAAVPFSETDHGLGDFRLIDVTDPTHPVQVGEWGVSKIGIEPRCDEVCFFGHSVFAYDDGNRVVLSYWDVGAILLDISNPSNPRFRSRTVYPRGADGNTHSGDIARRETLLLTADEDFSPLGPSGPLDTWGFLRIWNVANPAAPFEIGRFGTPNSLTFRDDGFFSIHNPRVRNLKAYLSWYSDGVRVIDFSNPREPQETAFFVPPATPDPFGNFPSVPLVWGVDLLNDLVVASDINAGLYVLRESP